MILDERSMRNNAVLDAVCSVMTAARTAPKARGYDIVEIIAISGDDIRRLSLAMLELHAATGRPVYKRDGENILNAQAIILIGIRAQPMGLDCGHCGFKSCDTKPANVPCAVNAVDVGIAIGSAVARAADLRLDTRVMFSVGMGAASLDLLPGCTHIYGIPVSASHKNPFFDR